MNDPKAAAAYHPRHNAAQGDEECRTGTSPQTRNHTACGHARPRKQRTGHTMTNATEWQASVGYMNESGQSERTHGYGHSREEALADARSQPRLLATTQEVGHVCSWRDVGQWHHENPTYEENDQ